MKITSRIVAWAALCVATGSHADPVSDAAFAAIQFPKTLGQVQAGFPYAVYSRIDLDGVTPGSGFSDAIESWLGYGTVADPAPWSTWAPAGPNAAYNPGSPSFDERADEYQATLTAPGTNGSYYYSFRYRYDGGDYFYAGQDNTWAPGQPLSTFEVIGGTAPDPGGGGGRVPEPHALALIALALAALGWTSAASPGPLRSGRWLARWAPGDGGRR